MKNNHSGSITIIGMVMLLLLSYLSLLHISILHKHSTQIKNRAQTYLCTKDLSIKTKKYIRNMTRFNRLIRANFYALIAAKLKPPLYAALKISHISLQNAQQLLHLSYLEKITISTKCHWHQYSVFVKKAPFKTLAGVLQREKSGVVGLKHKKWSFFLTGKIKTSHIILQGSYQLKSKYTALHRFSVKEIADVAATFL